MSKVKLGDVAIEHKETCKVSKDGYPIVGLEHLVPEEVTLTAWDEGSDNTFTKMFRKGNVLFGRRRAYLKKAAVASFDGICSGDITVIEAIPDRILPELLPFIIQNDELFDFAVGKSAGSLSPRVKWEHLKNYEFELPDMGKQRELAELLWAMDATKKSYQKLIAATDELVKSQFIETFGDPVTNEKGWPIVRLDSVADIRIGPFGSLLHKEDYIESGHALVNPSHIIDGKIVPDQELTVSDEKYDLLSAYQLEKGDVVLGRRGEMGRCAVVTASGMLCGTGSMIIRPNGKIRPYFLQRMLASPSFRKVIENKAVGVTMMNINVPIVSSLMLPLLPASLQDEYIAFVQQSDKSKFELEQTLSELTATYKRIIAENLG
mgnify:CR=1 FL=1